jgi:formylglycine-generating enzyme
MDKTKKFIKPFCFLLTLTLLLGCESQKPVRDNSALYSTLPDTIQIPENMIFVPGGSSVIGNNNGLERERPERLMTFKGFFMDKHPVTVGDFERFVNETGYITEATKFGDAGVFDFEKRKWVLIKGASWKFPLGESGKQAESDHPVTQVSWNDAKAYCKWIGKRLPTEEEWEYAASSAGRANTPFWWGTEFKKDGVFHANVWNGEFPKENNQADGYLLTSPVGKFGENSLGLQDMAGNVWEWCESQYLPYPGSNSSAPDEEERAQRGGSFMCDEDYCYGYRITARSGSSPETSLFHVGFRCVKDIE